MRAVLCAAAVPPVIGGSETLVANVAAGLVANGVEVRLISGTDPDDKLRRLVESSGGSVTRVRRAPSEDHLDWEYDCFFRAECVHDVLRQSPVDVIWVFSHGTAISATVALADRALDHVALVATFSEVAIGHSEFLRARSAYVHEIPRLDLNVVLSRRYRAIAGAAASARCAVTMNPIGVDVARFAAGSAERGRAVLAVPPGTRAVVCPSRFDERKGQLDLVEAFVDVARVVDDTHLYLLGSANSGSTTFERALRDQVAQSAHAEEISIRTDVTQADMPDVMAAATVVVQPSHFEGLGFVAIEAMAAGRPVLLTKVDGFEEFARHGENALVVAPRSPSALAAGLEELLLDSGYGARLGRGGAAFAHKVMNCRSNVGELLHHIEKAISRRRLPAGAGAAERPS